jgi:peptide-methionine (S)-S-oxide reductase
MKMTIKYWIIVILLQITINNTMKAQETYDTITLGSGCFWCAEAIYLRVNGVVSVTSGYSGGDTQNPSYREVCNGNTGHAEVVQVVFNTDVISISDILMIFFKTHDPTMLNRQGMDIGTQYRSVVFYHTLSQKSITEEIIKKLDDAKIWTDPIVTQVEAFTTFYPAEDYHQEYYEKNPNQAYCQFNITPQIEKFNSLFREFSK